MKNPRRLLLLALLVAVPLAAQTVPDAGGGGFLSLIGGTLTGTLYFSPDNTYDVGFNGSAPRNVYAGTGVRVRSATTIQDPPATNHVTLTSPSDGVLTLTDLAYGGFTALQLGGTTSAFPEIKRNATAVNFRLADDSANAPITAATASVDGLNATRTVTAAGTTGAQTINKMAGTVNFAAAAASLVVTDSTVTTSSIVFAVLRTNDATCRLANVVPAAGSFTITMTGACAAETSVGFMVTN